MAVRRRTGQPDWAIERRIADHEEGGTGREEERAGSIAMLLRRSISLAARAMPSQSQTEIPL